MITIQDHGPVRELRLARPPANALSPELVDALAAALEQAPRDGAQAIVLSGAPGMFCAGLDVPLLLPFGRSAIRSMWRHLYGMLRELAAAKIPVAAAITGHSPAGGAVLATYCDYRVMAEGNYKIGYNEVQVGIPMPVAILRCVARLVGDRQAERLCVGGLLLPAAEALRIGLIDEIVPAEQVVERAVEWCRAMTALPVTAMSRTREASRAGLVRLMDEGLAGELDQLVESWFHPEAQSVLHAVVERMTQKKKKE
jgi:enoyl-CoA hydratase/carnithine racemase